MSEESNISQFPIQENVKDLPNRELSLTVRIRQLYLIETKIIEELLSLTAGLPETQEFYDAYDRIQDGIALLCKCFINEHFRMLDNENGNR